jgi:hypothetical protein
MGRQTLMTPRTKDFRYIFAPNLPIIRRRTAEAAERIVQFNKDRVPESPAGRGLTDAKAVQVEPDVYSHISPKPRELRQTKRSLR